MPIHRHQPEPKRPRGRDGAEGEGAVGRHADEVAGAVGLRVEVRRVDVGGVGGDVDDGQADGLLLLRLAQRGGHPAQDHRVDRVGPAREQEAGDVPRRRVHRQARDQVPHQRHAHAARYVPRPLVEVAGRLARQEAEDPRYEVRRAG